MDPLLKLLQQHPHEDWPWTLDAARRGWTPRNALALANCSLLAYSDAGEIDRHLTARGFEAVVHCSSQEPRINTKAYVAARADAVIAAFRGTEPTKPQDVLTDSSIRQVLFEDVFGSTGWGLVHEGFALGTRAVLGRVREALRACGSDRPLYITGHSLGGAMAVVTAAALANEGDRDIAGVFTFGQPRVGNPDFRTRYDRTLHSVTYRCVNDCDLIAHLPPRDITAAERAIVSPRWSNVAEAALALMHHSEPREYYEHVGQLRLLLADGRVSEDLLDEAARQPPLLAGPRTMGELVRGLPSFIKASPKLIRDHFPINPDSRDGYVDRIEALVQ